MAKVSVVVPNYNKGAFIADTIGSVLAQSHQDFELIIVDDGSTDDSVAIAGNFARKDQRVKVYNRNREPKGGNTCRNIGIEKSTGDYILFLDSDDLLAPFCLEQRVGALEADKEIDFGLFTIGTFFNGLGDSNAYWVPPKDVDYLHRFLRHDLPWHTTSPLWRKETVTKVNGYNERMNWLQDVEFHSRILILTDARIGVFNELPPDSFYRISEKRITSTYPAFVANFVKGQLAYIREMAALLEKKGWQKKNRYLRGSIVSALRVPLYNHAMKRIPAGVEKQLVDQVMNDETVNGLIGALDRMIIKLYRGAYHAGIKRRIDKLCKLLLIRG